jgi:hypothetical protein
MFSGIGPWMVFWRVIGANLTLFDGVRIQPRLKDFDANARLVNLRYQGKNYSISGRGAAVVR